MRAAVVLPRRESQDGEHGHPVLAFPGLMAGPDT